MEKVNFVFFIASDPSLWVNSLMALFSKSVQMLIILQKSSGLFYL